MIYSKNERRKINRLLKEQLADKKGIRFLYILLMTLGMFIEMVMPGLYSVFVDEILIAGSEELFWMVAAGYMMLYAAGCLAGMAGQLLQNRLTNTLVYRLRMATLTRFFYTDVQRHQAAEEEIGSLKMRMDNDINKLSEFLADQYGTYGLQVLVTVCSGVILILLDWKLAVIGITAIPVTILLDDIIGKKESVLNEENRLNDGRMSTWLHTIVKGWKQVRMFQLEKIQEGRFVKFHHIYAIYNSRWINFWVTRILIIPKLKNDFLMEFGVYFLGGLALLKGRMTAGDLLVFIVYYHLMTRAMTAVSALDAQIKADMPCYLRVFKDMGDKPWISGKVKIDRIYTLKFSQMGFRYDLSLPLLFKDMNERFEKGDFVNVCGRSGCGKTTLMRLLLGTRKPSEGCFLVNGYSRENINSVSYYRRISGVLQGMQLFNDTIRENLRYAAPNASEEDMMEACKKAQVWEEIKAMPQGLNTVAGDSGRCLSGGQCQRLLLARAFLKEADVYLFDEVTSALDAGHAEQIYGEIQKHFGDKICFIISHDNAGAHISNRVLDLDALVNQESAIVD